MSAENTKINIFDNTILIGTISMIGYMAAFFYEYGYITYFDISPYFIEINLTTIFISVTTSFVIFFALFSLINIFSTSGLIDNDTAIGRSRFLIVVFVAPFVLSKILIYGYAWKEWIFAVFIFLILIIVEFVHPIIFRKDKKTLEEKLLAQEELESKIIEKDLFRKIVLMIGRMPFIFIFAALFFLSIANDIGKNEAMKQKIFPVVETDFPSVAIRIYSQSIIAVSFDEETKTLQKKLFILDKGDLYQQGLYLDYQDIGPLTYFNNNEN